MVALSLEAELPKSSAAQVNPATAPVDNRTQNRGDMEIKQEIRGMDSFEAVMHKNVNINHDLMQVTWTYNLMISLKKINLWKTYIIAPVVPGLPASEGSASLALHSQT